MDRTTPEVQKPQAGPEGSPSFWEWLPPVIVVVLAVVYVRVAAPGSTLERFSLFVGLGLLPGSIWRLTGKSSWNVHRVFFAVSLIAFVLNNPKLRPDRATWERILAEWPLVTLGFFISFTQSLWGTLRTQRLLRDSGVDIGLMGALKLVLCGSFFNIILPGSTGGDAYRMYAVSHDYNTRLAPAIASITLDRFLGLPSLILVVVLGMFLDYEFFRSNRILSSLIPFIAGAGVVCLVLVGYLAVAGRTRRGDAPEQTEGEGKGWLARTHMMIATNVTRRATLPLALLYGFLSHLASIASCQVFGIALGVEGVPALRYYLIVPMAMAINSIPGAPGGVGQGELAMATLLDMASPGMGNAQAGVMIMLLYRLSIMAVGIAGGMVYALGKNGFRGGDVSSAGDDESLTDRIMRVQRDSQRLTLGGVPHAGGEASGSPRDGD